MGRTLTAKGAAFFRGTFTFGGDYTPWSENIAMHGKATILAGDKRFLSERVSSQRFSPFDGVVFDDLDDGVLVNIGDSSTKSRAYRPTALAE